VQHRKRRNNPKMYKIVLLRHGESIWNKENLFTGWTDVDLSEKGVEEAKESGRVLKKEGYEFDLAYTTPLMRASKTLDLAEQEMGVKIPRKVAWQLNERHYGALQGLNKAETAAKYGDDQVLIWRRSYSTRPPLLEESDERHPKHDKNYKDLDAKDLPAGECLEDVVARVLPYWKSEIVPEIKAGKSILIAAHGNSLRALVKYLDGVPEDEILKLNIPTGIPLVYELDEDLKPIKHYYLGDEEKVKAAMNKVANQGKSKK
jgi:2,3-bisphosphoglycerate-dependent phosphoglycerate mutase